MFLCEILIKIRFLSLFKISFASKVVDTTILFYISTL